MARPIWRERERYAPPPPSPRKERRGECQIKLIKKLDRSRPLSHFDTAFSPRGMNIPPVFMALALLAAATLSSQAVTVTVSSHLASTNVAGNQLTNASGSSTSQALPSGSTGTISATSNLLSQNHLGNRALEFASATLTVSTAIFSTTHPANSNKPLRLRDFAHPTQGRSRICYPSSASANLAEKL